MLGLSERSRGPMWKFGRGVGDDCRLERFVGCGRRRRATGTERAWAPPSTLFVIDKAEDPPRASSVRVCPPIIALPGNSGGPRYHLPNLSTLPSLPNARLSTGLQVKALPARVSEESSCSTSASRTCTCAVHVPAKLSSQAEQGKPLLLTASPNALIHHEHIS